MANADPSLSMAERIDAACDRFEADWKAGKKPPIADFLAVAPQSDRAELRAALLAVELELQGKSTAETSVTQSSVRTARRLPAPDETAAHLEPVPPTLIGRFEVR